MSKPTLIIHIGTCKTGTSAIQMCLAKNKDFLMRNKICYAAFHESNNFHLNLSLGLVREYFEQNNISGAPVDIPLGSIPITSALYAEPPANIIERMKREFHAGNCDRMIISDEGLFEATFWWIFPFALNTEPLLAGRKKYLMRFFKQAFAEFDIKIVCYLRRQDDYVESLYNQWTKGMNAELYRVIFKNPSQEDKYKTSEDGALHEHMAKFINGMLKLDYYAVLAEWAEIYGKENIIVRTYEKSSLPNGAEHDFFTGVLGFDADSFAGVKLYEEVNASFSKDIIEYKMAARLFDLPVEIYDLNDCPALAHLRANRKNILAAKYAEEMLEYYGASNEKIAREYLGREDGVLFYDRRREAADDYAGLSTEAAVDISRELILALTARLE